MAADVGRGDEKSRRAYVSRGHVVRCTVMVSRSGSQGLSVRLMRKIFHLYPPGFSALVCVFCWTLVSRWWETVLIQWHGRWHTVPPASLLGLQSAPIISLINLHTPTYSHKNTQNHTFCSGVESTGSGSGNVSIFQLIRKHATKLASLFYKIN